MSTKTFAELLQDRGIKPVEVARNLGVDKSTVSRWCADQVPIDKVVAVEEATGISRFDLRPDLASIFVRPTAEETAA